MLAYPDGSGAQLRFAIVVVAPLDKDIVSDCELVFIPYMLF